MISASSVPFIRFAWAHCFSLCILIILRILISTPSSYTVIVYSYNNKKLDLLTMKLYAFVVLFVCCDVKVSQAKMYTAWFLSLRVRVSFTKSFCMIEDYNYYWKIFNVNEIIFLWYVLTKWHSQYFYIDYWLWNSMYDWLSHHLHLT